MYSHKPGRQEGNPLLPVFKDFCPLRPGIEPTTSRSRGGPPQNKPMVDNDRISIKMLPFEQKKNMSIFFPKFHDVHVIKLL